MSFFGFANSLAMTKPTRGGRPFVRTLLCTGLALLTGFASPAQDPYEHYPVPTGERQLFLDDLLLGSVHNVERVIHQPVKYEGNPVLRADRPWEGASIQIRSAPVWDREDELYKMWYFGPHKTGLATSSDGLHWRKPVLGLREHEGSTQNNMVVVEEDPEAFIQHVIADPNSRPERRYKGLTGWRNRRPLVSSDGLVFHLLDVPAIPSQDESHLNYDEKEQRYIATVKQRGPFGRSVYLSTSSDFESWTPPMLIFHADWLDQELGRRRIREHLANPKLYTPLINKPDEYNVEIYNMPVFPYEGTYIGLPNFFESSGRTPPPHNNQDGVNSVKLATSRDLRRWTKVGKRDSFIPVSDFNDRNLDSVQILAASRPIAVGEELWFYYTGINRRYNPDGSGAGGIHLARLRRDGFVSFHAGDEGGFVETRAIRFEGSRLFVNADASNGEIRVDIVNERGREVLAGWEPEKCVPIRGDHLRTEVQWQGRELRSLAGKTVRFRFHLRDAHLYSFWLEP